MGCTKSRCWKSSGHHTTESRFLDAFESLHIEGKVDVRIVQDTLHLITVHAGRNVIPHITSEVIDGTLYLSNDNSCNFLRKADKSIFVTLFVPSLHTIDFRGSGNVTSITPFVCDSMRIDLNDASGTLNLNIEAGWSHSKIHTGPGDVTLRGSSNNHFAYSTGNGFIDCSELESPIASAVNRGTGDISVFASEILSAEISHTGWVKYTGNPATIHHTLTGSGQLIEL